MPRILLYLTLLLASGFYLNGGVSVAGSALAPEGSGTLNPVGLSLLSSGDWADGDNGFGSDLDGNNSDLKADFDNSALASTNADFGAWYHQSAQYSYDSSNSLAAQASANGIRAPPHRV